MQEAVHQLRLSLSTATLTLLGEVLCARLKKFRSDGS